MNPEFLARDGLPLWDTFEASFFLLAGLSTGLVFGFLFPSLWRGLRRRLTRPSWVDLQSEDLRDLPLEPQLFLIENEETVDEDEIRTPLSITSQYPRQDQAEIHGRFVLARALFQKQKLRDAVRTYVHLLRSPTLSTKQTMQVYLELSQVYCKLALHDRALALIKEVQAHRPASTLARDIRFELASTTENAREYQGAIKAYRGRWSEEDKLKTVHQLCAFAESAGEKKKSSASRSQRVPTRSLLNEARNLMPDSHRVRVVLADTSFQQTIAQNGHTAAQLWILLFAETLKRIHLVLNQGIAMAPLLKTLQEIAVQLSVASDLESGYVTAQPELSRLLSGLNPKEKLIFQEIGCQLAWQISSPHTPQDALLERVIELAYITKETTPWPSHFPEYLSQHVNFDCHSAFKIAMTIHSCSRCRHQCVGFEWQCPHCKARESLQRTDLKRLLV